MSNIEYYDFGPLLEKNGTYNFVIGGRGIGKTYGAKKLVIEDFLKNGRKFIYLRRYKNELRTIQNMFVDVGREFPDYAFRVRGHHFEICDDPEPVKGSKWIQIGIAVALSTAQQMKSMVFDEFDTILFDEFIIEKGCVRYLPDEFSVFNNFYNTVDRWNDRVKVFFLANAVRIENPYMVALEADADREWSKRKRGFAVPPRHSIRTKRPPNQVRAIHCRHRIRRIRHRKHIPGQSQNDDCPKTAGRTIRIHHHPQGTRDFVVEVVRQ